MKASLFFSILIATFLGCNNRSEELEKQNSTLQRSNQDLIQNLGERDEYIDKVSETINDVYSNLESMQAKEKLIVKEKTELEAQKKYSKAEIREMLLDKIGTISAELKDNHHLLADLQTKVNSYKTQYAGVKKMVAGLKKSIEERDKSIAELNQQVQGLQTEVNEKKMLVMQRDSVIDQKNDVIDDQERKITTAFYITGTREELEKRGIIKKEGGFLWGLLGSTTTLASGFDDKYFKPINKVAEKTILVAGKISDIVPKRNEQFYKKSEVDDKQSMLTIAEPDRFWQDKYLVIITDQPSIVSNE